MALYGYTVIAGIIIWWGGDGYTGASRNSRLGGGKAQMPPYVQKRPPICTKSPPNGEKSSKNATTW